MNKDYIKKIENGERRFCTAEMEHKTLTTTRDDGDGGKQKIVTAEGYAALFNVRAKLGWFDEIILPGAFDEVLKDDVRVLFNHEPNLILARSNDGEGSLELSVDDKGLYYRFEIPDSNAGWDLQVNLENKNITQSSFGFQIKKANWVEEEGEEELREIVTFSKLWDVSPVTYPAYPDTTIAKRNFETRNTTEKTIPGTTDKRKLDGYEARYRLLTILTR